MNSYYCYSLSKIKDNEEFGGKAINLARVYQSGYSVPETVVISCKALAQFIDKAGLRECIDDYVFNSNDTNKKNMYESIVANIDEAVVPEKLQSEVLRESKRLLELSPYGLAIRSSAVYEDSEQASFAGVFASFLGVKDPVNVMKKVIACWLSAWTPRALQYMKKMGIEPIINGMAVMIQKIVPAISSGVIYTADPKSGNPWHFNMEATHGLAIDLMSGKGVGDFYQVCWDSGEILKQEIVAKPTSFQATTEGVECVNYSGDFKEPALADSDVAEITKIALNLDEYFGSRLDIEWVITSEGVSIVQARPLTALPDYFPVSLTPEQKNESWKLAMVTLPLREDQEPSLLTPLYSHYSEAEMWHRYQPDDIIFTSITKHVLDVNGYRYWDAEIQLTFQDFFQGPGEYSEWIEQNESYYRQRWDNRRKEMEQIRDTAYQGISRTTTAAELIPVFLDIRDKIWDLNSFGWSGPQALGWMCEAALNHFLQENNLDVDTSALIYGGNDSYTYQYTRNLQILGRAINNDKVAKTFTRLSLDEVVPYLLKNTPDCEFISQLESICWRFGKRPPSWLNRPSFWSGDGFDVQIVNTIKNSLLGKSQNVENLYSQSLKKRSQYEQSIREDLTGKEENVIERFNKLLLWARYWGQALTDRHELGSVQKLEQELIWHVGNRLLCEGLLQKVEDVLLLKQSDLEIFVQNADPMVVREIYPERLYQFRRNKRLTPLPVLGKDQQMQQEETVSSKQREPAATCTDEFKGRGYGGGEVVGQAKKIDDLFDAAVLESLTPEDVLVLPYEMAFHYADWHSLLTVIKAVVSPGRPSHHLAQIARECSVPLVGRVQGDLAAVPEGSTLRVDGANGVVQLLT